MKHTHLRHAASESTANLAVDLRGDVFRWARADTGESLVGRAFFTAPGEGFLDLDGRIVPFSAAPLKVREQVRGIQVWMQGRVCSLERVEEQGGRRRGGGGAASGEVLAPMPGTVLQLRVRPGDVVEVGAPVVVMESMKMEMTLAASVAGEVEAVRCAVGELVDMGATLVRIRPVEGSAPA